MYVLASFLIKLHSRLLKKILTDLCLNFYRFNIYTTLITMFKILFSKLSLWTERILPHKSSCVHYEEVSFEADIPRLPRKISCLF